MLKTSSTTILTKQCLQQPNYKLRHGSPASELLIRHAAISQMPS